MLPIGILSIMPPWPPCIICCIIGIICCIMGIIVCIVDIIVVHCSGKPPASPPRPEPLSWLVVRRPRDGADPSGQKPRLKAL